MTSFWFTLVAGALIASPIAWAAGRYGITGLLDLLVAVIGQRGSDLPAAVRRHPSNPTDRCFRHVTLLHPEPR